MTVSKKFFEAVSKDEALKAELEQATLEALGEFLKSKGLEEETGKIAEAAMTKVAEAHGFKADEMQEVSEDELKAVAGGYCSCNYPGAGTGTQDCTCSHYGSGMHNSKNWRVCMCMERGTGQDWD